MEQQPFKYNEAFPNKIKNVPVLDAQTGVKEIIKCDFDFTDEFYKTFQEFICANPGKTSKELSQMITFYSFTEYSLEIAMKMFNTYKHTWYGVCGPFIYKSNRWFPVYSKKYTDTVILAQENSVLRQKIKELEEKLANKE